jgi:putative membrane protein
MRFTAKVIAGVAIVGLGACAPAPEPQASKASGPSDAEIAAIVVAANAVDAELGDLATARGNHPEVRQFGTMMSNSHRAVNQAAGELVTKLKVTPVENVTSRKLRSDGSAVIKRLSTQTGPAFDRAYLTHEVEYHRAVIDAVDQVLIPNADNAELKQAIVDVRPVLAGHLAHAERLLAGLK